MNVRTLRASGLARFMVLALAITVATPVVLQTVSAAGPGSTNPSPSVTVPPPGGGGGGTFSCGTSSGLGVSGQYISGDAGASCNGFRNLSIAFQVTSYPLNMTWGGSKSANDSESVSAYAQVECAPYTNTYDLSGSLYVNGSLYANTIAGPVNCTGPSL